MKQNSDEPKDFKILSELGQIYQAKRQFQQALAYSKQAYEIIKNQDSLDDLIVSKYSSSVRVGGGVNFILGSFVKGGIRAGTINSRDDWEENYVSGSIALGF